MGAAKVVARLRYILDEFREEDSIPYYRIEDIIKHFDREQSDMLDTLYKESGNISWLF
mgnify:FL=1